MLEVKVTQEDIDRGIRYNESLCPIALSLIKKAPIGDKVRVNEEKITVGTVRYTTTRRARKFITNFDSSREKVEPITFRLSESTKGRIF